MPVKEALLVQYTGVYAPPPSVTLLGKANAPAGVKLAYRITRPSTVTANVVGPDGAVHTLDSGSRQPGTYSFTWSSFDSEGTWHWTVNATDDRNDASTADRTFAYDLTLTGLSVPRSSSGGVKVGFTLSRPASAALSISAPNGTQVADGPGVQSGRGCPVAQLGRAHLDRREGTARHLRRHRDRDELRRHRLLSTLVSSSTAKVRRSDLAHRRPRPARRLPAHDRRRRPAGRERGDDALRRRARLGALAGHIALFGHDFSSGLPAYLAVVVAGIAGNTLGAAGGWWIGVRGGHPLLERYGRYIHVTPARIARAERWFERFEGVAVPLGFATPLVRSFVAIPAGILEVAVPAVHRPGGSRDRPSSAPCSPGSAGRPARATSTVHHDFRYVELVVVLALVVFAAVLLIRRRRSTTITERCRFLTLTSRRSTRRSSPS